MKYRQLNRALHHVVRMHHMLCEQGIGELGIHRAQHMLLMHLSKQETIPSQKDLAEHMHISPAAVAVALKKLESDGYITKSVDQNDNRNNCIAITQKGRTVTEESRKRFDDIDTSMYRGIDEQTLQICMDVLEKILVNMQNDLDSRKETV